MYAPLAILKRREGGVSQGPSETAKASKTHEMLPSWLKALIQAMATARFIGGRGNEPLSHERKTQKPAYELAMRNIDT